MFSVAKDFRTKIKKAFLDFKTVGYTTIPDGTGNYKMMAKGTPAVFEDFQNSVARDTKDAQVQMVNVMDALHTKELGLPVGIPT